MIKTVNKNGCTTVKCLYKRDEFDGGACQAGWGEVRFKVVLSPTFQEKSPDDAIENRDRPSTDVRTFVDSV
jgi:hypothetical protein